MTAGQGILRPAHRLTLAIRSAADRKEFGMAGKQKIGWIGIGRMGFPMAERLLDAGHDLAIWNRTRGKAEPLAKKGARVAARPADLADVDVLFTIVSTGRDVEEVLFGDGGAAAGDKLPKLFVD